jgi:hypothetical protein
MSWFWLAFIGFGLVGLIVGRLLLVALPIVVWFIWLYVQGPISPDDDVTGPAMMVLMILGVVGIVSGLILRRSIRFLLSLGHEASVGGIGEPTDRAEPMEATVPLTVVGTQIEAEIVCSLLLGNGIRCGERAAGVAITGTGSFGGSREIFVLQGDFDRARDVLAAKRSATADA